MFELNKIVRKNILALQPYSSAREEFDGTGQIYLDANENPFGTYNRYPDPKQMKVKSLVSELYGINMGQIFVGNGSDEAIDLLCRIFCRPGKDKILTFLPTYGMYKVSAKIQDVGILEIPLTDSFQIDFPALEDVINKPELKIIFICSPNNPTGNTIERIEEVCARFQGIVVVDEAYVEFSTGASLLKKIQEHPNLVVLRTLSKAWGLAGARFGFAFSDSSIIDLLNKVKPPYNISVLNQSAAVYALENREEIQQKKDCILQQRKYLEGELKKRTGIKHVYPSETNFILVEVDSTTELYTVLLTKGIVVRNREKEMTGCLRITVGTPQENKQLLNAITLLEKQKK